MKPQNRLLVLMVFFVMLLNLSGIEPAQAAHWEWQNPLPTGNNLTDVWRSPDGTDVFAVGSFGTILRWNGSTWTTMNSGTLTDLYGVWGTSSSDVFAVGRSGTILHYDGTDWTQQTSNTTAYLYDVWGSAGNDVWAVGTSGRIVRYNGTNWTETIDPSGATFQGIHGSGAANIYAVGSVGNIIRWTGSVWANENQSVSTNYLYGVWVDSTGTVYATGANGTVLVYTVGAGWSGQENTGGTAQTLRDVWGSSTSDVIAVGHTGGIIHWNGSNWNTDLSGVVSGLYGLHGPTGNGSEVYAVGTIGTILQYNGSAWSPFGTSSVSSEGLNAIWGSSASNLYAVGSNGTILHSDGNAWSQETSNTTETLNAIWGSSASNLFAVGASGTVVRYDGSNWTATSESGQILYDVWGSSDSDIFAVGDTGTIIHWDGSGWTTMTSGTDERLNSVWGFSRSDVYAVGTFDGALGAGTMLHYNGSAWSQVPDIPLNDEIYDIWGSGPDNIYAIGYGGSVMHYDGRAWRMIESRGYDVEAVWGSSANDVYILDGTDLFHYDGYTWYQVADNFSSPNNIWGTSADDVYVVRSHGGILNLSRENLYVDINNGSDNNDGTSPGTGAWRTIHHAVNEINLKPAGNYTLHVAPGTYSVTNGEAPGTVNITQDNLQVLGQDGVLLDGEYFANGWDFGITINASEVVLRELGFTRFRSDANVAVTVNSGGNNLVEACEIFDNDVGVRANIASSGTAVVACDLYSNGEAVLSRDAQMTVTGNRIYQNVTGVFLENYTDNIRLDVTNNVFYGTDSQVHQNGINTFTYSGSTVVTAYHNTMAGIANGIDLFYSGQTASMTANIRYNIIADADVGIAFDDGIGGTLTGPDYNTVHNCTTPYSNVTTGANDLSSDPLFVNPGNFDFHLQLASPAKDSIPLSTNDPITIDIDGLARPQGDGFDRGAYERLGRPFVLSVDPANGALGVMILDQSITAVFSQDMNPGTFDETTFQVAGGNGNINGTISVSGATAIFTPDADLPYGAVVSIRLTTGLQDTFANTLDHDYTWFFTTIGAAGQGASFAGQAVITTDAQTAFSVHAADVDGDGDLDVLSASDGDDTVAWYANTDGTGTFGPANAVSTSATGARSVFARDIDGDSDPDVVAAAWGGNQVAWYRNGPPAGTFSDLHTQAHAMPAGVYVADLDNDGDIDVLSASYGDDTIAWHENLDGIGSSWTEHSITTLADGAWDVYAADLDNDGDLDVISAANWGNDENSYTNENGVAWYENRLNEVSNDFGPQQVISAAADGARVVRAADMDQDGDMDVISASWFDGKIAWYANQGGSFGDPAGNQNIIATAEVFTQAMHVADLDNDGDVDVLYGSWRDDTGGTGRHAIIWMENTNGLGTAWSSADISTAVDGCQALYAADLDADGDLDVLSASQDDNKIAWYENQAGAQPTQYSLTINNVGQGSVTRSPAGAAYDSGTQVTLTPVSDAGWRFDSWSGDLTGTDDPALITMDSNKTITAIFVETLQEQYTLALDIVGQGSVTLSPPGGTYDESTVVTLTAVPATSWHFVAWSADLSGSTNPTSITMDADKFVTASFETYPDTPTADDPPDEGAIEDGSIVILETSDYNDPDGDDHLASTWVVWRADNGEILENLRSPSYLTSYEITSQLTEGLKYYWQVTYEDEDGNLSESRIYAFKVGESESESLPAVAAGRDVGDFGMISIVHWPDDPSPTAVFNIDYDPANYRIGTYDALNGSYIEFGQGLTMEPGRAYWILAREGLTVNFNGIPVSETAEVYVALDYNDYDDVNPDTGDGWNMVAPPNDFHYHWRNVRVVVGDIQDPTFTGTVQDLEDQEAQEGVPNDYIDLRLWRWVNGGYVSETADDDPVMEAYAGYWVKAKQANVYLMFEESARVASLGMPDTMVARAWHKTKAWLKSTRIFSREAMADNDSPPMPPAALNENSVDPVFGGCFIDSTESFDQHRTSNVQRRMWNHSRSAGACAACRSFLF